MPAHRTLVLLDPDVAHGEAALDLARAEDAPITLLLALDAPRDGALAAFADSEGTTVAEAGDLYLRQVEDSLGGRDVEAVSVHGAVLPAIVRLAERGAVGRVAVPAGSSVLPPRALARLADVLHVPLVVAPAAA